MTRAKKKSADRKRALDRLMAAMDRCALTRAEAMWTNGYRAAKEAFEVGTRTTAEHDRLYEKMQAQFAINDRAEQAFRRLAAKLLREARALPSGTKNRSQGEPAE